MCCLSYCLPPSFSSPSPSSTVRTSNTCSSPFLAHSFQDNPSFHMGSSWKSPSLLPGPWCAVSTPQQVLGSAGQSPDQDSCIWLLPWARLAGCILTHGEEFQVRKRAWASSQLRARGMKKGFKVLNTLHLDSAKYCQNTGSVQTTTLYLNFWAPNFLVLQTLKHCTIF